MANPLGDQPQFFYTCPTCFKKCKSPGGLVRHRNSEHREFTPESDDGTHKSTFDFHPLLTGMILSVIC